MYTKYTQVSAYIRSGAELNSKFLHEISNSDGHNM